MKERLKQILKHRQRQCIVDNNRVSSAILLPVYWHEGQYHMLFIKRTETVKDHKGQISFPGGTCEKEDNTLLDTALRESYEEIGLSTKDAEVLGELDDAVTTTSNYLVTPFVAMIPWPYEFTINREEVDEIIYIPIRALLDENCLRQETEILDGQMVESYAYHYQDRVIWGATARILNRFLDILVQAMQDK